MLPVTALTRLSEPDGRATDCPAAAMVAGPRAFCAGVERGLSVVDATCPLVAKVHAEARRFAARGDTVVLVGHAGHEEAEGTSGEAPESIVVVEDVLAALRGLGPVEVAERTTGRETVRFGLPGLAGVS